MPRRWRPRRPRVPWTCPPSSQSSNYSSTSTIYEKNGWACCPGGGAPDDLACPGRVPRAPTHTFFPRASCGLRSRVPLPRSHAAALATPPSRRKASVHSEPPSRRKASAPRRDAWARGRFLLPTRAAPQTWKLMQACGPAPPHSSLRALGPATAASPRLRRGATTPRATSATRSSPRDPVPSATRCPTGGGGGAPLSRGAGVGPRGCSAIAGESDITRCKSS